MVKLSKPEQVREIIDRIETEKSELEVMPTGFKQLDAWLDGGFLRKELVIIGGFTGIGKAQSLDSVVYTRFGPKKMGDIKIGDVISNPSGKSSTVIAVHPQGIVPLYKMFFDDGTSTVITSQHLWLGWKTRSHRTSPLDNSNVFPNINHNAKLYTTADIAKCMQRGENIKIPITQPIQFTHATSRWIQEKYIHPYVLGVILGDGGLTQGVNFTCFDEEIIKKIEEYCLIKRLKTKGVFSINGIKRQLDQLGLMGLKSAGKFIPSLYKVSSIEDRTSLIQGLMDTDGYVTRLGQMQFTSVSKQLSYDFLEVVRSLGAWATISNKTPQFNDKNGDKKNGQLAYTIYFRSAMDKDLVFLPRKRARIKPYNNGSSFIGKTITKIEYLKDDYAQCITVDHPNGLYITDNFTVTHNSYIAGQLLYNIAKAGFKCAYFSLEISNGMVVSRLLGSVANVKPTHILMGKLFEDEQVKTIKAKADLEILNQNLYFYDDLYTLDEVVAEIRKEKYEFIVVDFIQNVLTKEENEYARLSKIALELQKIAKEINGTILSLSQLSNAVAREGMTGKNLQYKGSGSIATVCDLGFFIEREDKEWNPNSDNPLKLTLHKNRRGGSGIEFHLFFKVPGGKIYEP